MHQYHINTSIVFGERDLELTLNIAPFPQHVTIQIIVFGR